jgi:hypothetical protein
MTTRRINAILWTAAATMSLAAAAALVMSFTVPLASPDGRASPTVSSPTTQPDSPSAMLPDMQSLEPVFNKHLRANLDASAPAAASTVANATTAPAAGQPALVLVGTIGQHLAMIRTPDGVVAVKGVGEQVAGADVLAIRPTQVDLRIAGRTVTLQQPVESDDTR